MQLADMLNGSGHTTRRGCRWNAMQVSRMLRMGRTVLKSFGAAMAIRVAAGIFFNLTPAGRKKDGRFTVGKSLIALSLQPSPR